MIDSRNLWTLQSKLTSHNKTIPVKTLEKDYVLSWVLAGIADSDLFKSVVFKGGTALKKIYFGHYRFSEDLDFTLLNKLSADKVEHLLTKVFEYVFEASNIRLSLKSRDLSKNGFTFYANYSGPLGADISRGEIKIDVTANEKIIINPLLKPLLNEHKEYYDLPDNISIHVYSLEEIFIEKYISIIDKRRNEPRDIYDLWYLVINECLDYNYLAPGIKTKAGFKGIDELNIITILKRKKTNYNSLWIARLGNHMIELPIFDKVYRELTKNLRKLSDRF